MRLKENFDLLIAAFVTLSIVFYDLTLELVLELVHMTFEVAHIMFEWFELGVEDTVEHLFHTSRHGSQIVTFYILMAILAGLCYLAWRIFPKAYTQVRQWALGAWIRRRTQFELYWQYQSLPRKLTLAATALVVAYLASFFVM